MSTSPHQSYDFLLHALNKAQTFEEVCSLLHEAIARDPGEGHKDLYAFLSQNAQAVEAIHRFKGHEKFHTALWSIIYDEHADLTGLPGLAGAVKFSAPIAPMDPHKALTITNCTHYPAVIDNPSFGLGH